MNLLFPFHHSLPTPGTLHQTCLRSLPRTNKWLYVNDEPQLIPWVIGIIRFETNELQLVHGQHVIM